MDKIECKGMVGKFPTPKGEIMFYDTGRSVSLADLAELMALQSRLSEATPESLEQSKKDIFEQCAEIARKTDVYPVGYAAIADDDRIFVSEPWFESKAEHSEGE